MRDADDLEGYEALYDEAYDLDDPKHPSFAEQWLDWADAQRKREKEDGPQGEPDASTR